MISRPVAGMRLDEPTQRRRDFARISAVAAALCLTYLALAVLLELLQVYPFPIWPGMVVGVVTVAWLSAISWLAPRLRSITGVAYTAYAIQALLITLAVHLVGGIHSLLPVLYAFNVAAAAYVLGVAGGLVTAAASIVLLAAVWLLESGGVVPLYAIWSPQAVQNQTWVVSANAAVLAVPMLATVGAVASISAELRRRQRAVAEYRRQAEGQLAALRQAESRFKLQSNRLEAILHSTHEGMMLYDTSGRLVFSNPVVEHLLAAPASLAVAEANGATASGSLSRCLSQELDAARRDPTTATHRLLTLKGPPTRYLAVDGFPVTNRENRLIGRLLILRDISDQKELEAARDEWTNMLVHDLRSPLIGVLGNLELAQEMMVSENQAPAIGETVRMAHKSARDLLDMVNSLLDISKLESKTDALERVPVSLPHLAAGVLHELSMVARIGRLRLRLDAPSDLPMVVGDREKLQRVLTNLLDNAIKFTPDQGSVTLEMSREDDRLRVSVMDTGPGIPEEQRLAVFGRYAQLAGVSGRRAGTGLGLTFCKLVVEAHGGRIWVEGPPEGGSRFVFTLPIDASVTPGGEQGT